jgi:signal transduction histidine kinase
MGLPLLILGITNTCNLLLLGLTLFRRRNSATRGTLIVFTLSIVSLVLWSTSNYLADTRVDLDAALFWTRASFPPALFMCWFVFYLSCIFPVHRHYRYPFVFVYGLLVVFLSFMSMGSSVVTSVGIDPQIGISDVVVGTIYLPVLLLYVVLILHTTGNFIYDVRKLTGRERARVAYVLMGWGTFLSFAVITNALLPLITGSANWSKFGPLGSVVMVACIAYAMVKHEFLDIKFIIQRGIVFSILLSLLLIVYVLLLFLTQFAFSATSETNVFLSGFVTALIGVFGVTPLTEYFKKITAPIFFKDAYNYREVLSELSSVLNENIDESMIVEKSSRILLSALKAHDVVFHISENSYTPLEAAELEIPIRSNGKIVGSIELTSKRSEDPYTHEDISLLTTFSTQAGVALEKARLYKQVKEYAETLEERVQERTQAIERLQKEQESMMLEISHGLQTPLTIMKGELFFLRKQGYETEKVDALDGSINRISLFIKKLLDLYRLEGGTLTAPTSVDLGEVLTNVAHSFKSSVTNPDVTITTQIEDLVTIQGDHDGIEEAITNLVSNAIKYSEKGKTNHIVLSLRNDEPHTVTIKVTDTGIGMRQEDMQGLFKKFYRIKDELTRQIQGTGLGLATCKRIVEMHGGTITVESTLGHGTTFIVQLPV